MTSGDEKLDLIRAAEAVSDGIPLDWTAGGPAPEEQPLLEHLRAIESIARVHREAAEGSGAAAAPAATGPPAPPAPGAPGAAGGLGTWGELVLLERIGGGSFGDVYRAYDPSLEREVALKLFRSGGLESASSRSLDEARRLARVRHSNVVVILGVDERDGRVGLWTELLRGRTL